MVVKLLYPIIGRHCEECRFGTCPDRRASLLANDKHIFFSRG